MSRKAAVCDCGTPWTFLLPFLYVQIGNKYLSDIRSYLDEAGNVGR